MSESRNAVLKARFLHPGEMSWYDVAERAARTWGSYGNHTGALYEMISRQRGVINTPAMANAGRVNQMGSACYVLPVNDSLTDGEASIMQTLMDAASVHKSGGGTGFSFGRIRGRGTPVSSTGRPAPGAVNVLKLYSQAISGVTQAGMRPGANMAILPVDHPDIEEFIKVKQVEGDIYNFNISVGMTDKFMKKVVAGTLDHHEAFIWESIVQGAWLNGEPGIFFLDTTNNAALHDEWIEATNPCGEVPLRPYEACVLGSINVAAYDWGRDYSEQSRFCEDVAVMTEALDNVIERQTYPIPQIEVEQKRYRKIGVGLMGYADALVQHKMLYGSADAMWFADHIGKLYQDASYEASEKLSWSRGFYDGWEKGMPERRNLNCQVIAPTGTISRLAECSFGIEPHFDVDANGNYESFIVGGQFTDHNPHYNSPYFKPASQVTLDEHLDTQAAFQRHVDQAVSKTINCPYETTQREVEEAYIKAWKLGLKGTTILREGSRKDVVIGKVTEGDCVGGVCPV